MIERLRRREYEPEIIEEAIAQLHRENYLSDTRFAEAYLRSRMHKGEAPWLAAERARQKGVESSAVAAAVAQFADEHDDEAACRALLESRDPMGLRFEDERVWQRQARFLRNKGYNSATILRVLKERSFEQE